MVFTLKTGRTVTKAASYCVATKARGRWSHKFFKSERSARNEYTQTKRYLSNPDMAAYYDLQECSFIKGVEA